jgi:hypothetical protein
MPRLSGGLHGCRAALIKKEQPAFLQLLTSEQSFAEDELLEGEESRLAEGGGGLGGLALEPFPEDERDEGFGAAAEFGGLLPQGGRANRHAGWTGATEHVAIPETPHSSKSMPPTPVMQRMALEGQGNYKKGYRPSGEAKKLLAKADRFLQVAAAPRRRAPPWRRAPPRCRVLCGALSPARRRRRRGTARPSR